MSTMTPPARRGLPETGLKVIRTLVKPYVDWRWDVHQSGEDKVPETGPVILASNHVGWLDGPLLCVHAPRPPHALVKEEEFAGHTGALLRATGQIRVSRTRNDTGALRRASQALSAGQAVLIYPEGFRGAGEFDSLKGGVAWLALVSGAPVVPVSIFGTRQPGEPADTKPAKGARVDVVYGDPIQLPMREWPRDRVMLADAGEQILHHLRAHVSWSKEALNAELPGPLPRGSVDD